MLLIVMPYRLCYFAISFTLWTGTIYWVFCTIWDHMNICCAGGGWSEPHCCKDYWQHCSQTWCSCCRMSSFIHHVHSFFICQCFSFVYKTPSSKISFEWLVVLNLVISVLTNSIIICITKLSLCHQFSIQHFVLLWYLLPFCIVTVAWWWVCAEICNKWDWQSSVVSVQSCFSWCCKSDSTFSQ